MAIKILVFDDDELIRMTLTNFLKQEGYEVASFNQPDHCPMYYSDAGLCHKEEGCADIIITDLNMPGTNGINFIERQLQQGCKVKKIAVMSGDWGDSGLVRAEELGCKVFKKPFSIMDMKKWLEGIRKDFQERPVPLPLILCEQPKDKTCHPKITTSGIPLFKPVK
jgi:CheY-like chemotaxis protein